MSAIIALSNDGMADVVFAWMREKYAEQRNAAKKLALLASCDWHSVSARTSQKWLYGKTPSATSIEIMAARCDDLAERVRQQREALRASLR